MNETNWKVAKCEALIPVGVTLHNSDTGKTFIVPTLYDPKTETVFSLQDQFLSPQMTDAVRDYVKNKDISTQPEVVDEKTWNNIMVLSRLASTKMPEIKKK